MSKAKQGHYVRMKRPTPPEVYQDAACILEELLERQLGNDRQRPKSHRSVPGRHPFNTGEVLEERAEFALDDGIERSKTMPSRPRPSRDEKLKQSDVDALRKSSEKRSRSPDASAASSEASDGDSSLVSENRKKKSLFRKAKDRLRHAFHRQERESKMKVTEKDGGKESPKTDKSNKRTSPKGRKTGKNGLQDSEKAQGSPYSIGDFRTDKPSPPKNKQSAISDSEKRRYTLDSKDGCSTHIETDGKRRNSTGKSFFNSIRRSFSSGKKDRRLVAGAFEGSNSGLASSDKSLSVPSQAPDSSRPSPDASGHSLLPPPLPHDKSPSPFPQSSSTDSQYGDKSSSLHSHLSTHSKNVLDDPGDDIEFMDAQSDPKLIHVGGVKGFVSGGRGRPLVEKQSSLVADGESDANDGKDDQGKPSLDDIPFHQRTKEEKEELYGKIAKVLLTIGDRYAAESGLSDSDSHPAGAQGGGDVIPDLEKQIADLLRSRADITASQIDQHANAFVQHTAEEIYARFKQTVQNSLGHEVSWNHLAFLFYTTKGVVSAVGKGTQAANTVKEMTLRYFSDKFASWIMDQGGFDSVLSESDSELD